MKIKKIHLFFLMLAMLLVALSTVSVSANPVDCPGTATPGYLKRNPEVWNQGAVWAELMEYFDLPDDSEQILAWLESPVRNDKTITLFKAAFAAKYNFMNGCYCPEANQILSWARFWLKDYPPGSGVEGSSDAWQMAVEWYEFLDDYNNGEICFWARD